MVVSHTIDGKRTPAEHLIPVASVQELTLTEVLAASAETAVRELDELVDILYPPVDLLAQRFLRAR